ncbi:MAG: hypothetical protein ACOYLT_05225 [Flavobacterium sp.]|uniref:hypothetical protein n=1 Tax=Flavobacterium sp. TaxID=239 RepID=UPI003BECB043
MFKKENVLSSILQMISFTAIITFVYMGYMYNFNDFKITLFVTLISTLPLAFLTYYLVNWKTKKKKANKDLNNRVAENVLLSIYIVIAIFLFFIVNNYFNVEFNKKDSIKKEVLNYASDNFPKLITQYKKAVDIEISNRETKFSNGLAKVRGSKNKTGFSEMIEAVDGTITSTDIDYLITYKNSYINRLKTDKYRTDSISNSINNYTNELKRIFNNWEITQVKFYYENIGNQYNKFYSILQNKFPDRTFEGVPFKSKFPTILTSLTNGSVIIIFLALLVYVLMHLFILYVYFSATRPEGLETQGNKKQNDDALLEF